MYVETDKRVFIEKNAFLGKVLFPKKVGPYCTVWNMCISFMFDSVLKFQHYWFSCIDSHFKVISKLGPGVNDSIGLEVSHKSVTNRSHLHDPVQRYRGQTDLGTTKNRHRCLGLKLD